ncbi:MAG TPA: hypothetical protein VLA62_06815, partial [Solirubrobacterales bacterium]|nr:hypothetical protein [Solirubrobacterales bacterium]
NRQVKNFLTVTLLAVGLPMILMGDEVRRTQRGNNNLYIVPWQTASSTPGARYRTEARSVVVLFADLG